jgi:hypothetical protein
VFGNHKSEWCARLLDGCEAFVFISDFTIEMFSTRLRSRKTPDFLFGVLKESVQLLTILKAQDQKDRESLSRRRDEAARRIFDIASRYIPPGVDRDVFEKEKERVKRMNKEIDGNTELYIPWNLTRADLRKTGRAVTERKQED